MLENKAFTEGPRDVALARLLDRHGFLPSDANARQGAPTCDEYRTPAIPLFVTGSRR
jgi:hypothetical protein